MLIGRSIYPHTHAPSRNSNRAQIILLHFKCDSLFLAVYKSFINTTPLYNRQKKNTQQIYFFQNT